MNINNIDDISRLALLNIENNSNLALEGMEGYRKALNQLKRQKLRIIATDMITNSKALQAAFLTAINTGKRAFKGGVFITVPSNVPMLLPWSHTATLNEVAMELGGIFDIKSDSTFTLHIGENAKDNNSLEIVANCWQGGVIACGDQIQIDSNPDGVLGGVFAGSLGVALGFLRVSGEKKDSTILSKGISLWRPDLDWTNPNAIGPSVSFFPKKIWMLGLGHLGQAYVWTLSLFSFNQPSELNILLQDVDTVKKANIDTGLLSENHNLSHYKTRVCSKWLESRGINTQICERLFDESYVPSENESDILICGLDSISTRRILDTNKFKNILDCGLGGNKSNFDSVSFFNLGELKKSANEIWEMNESGKDNPESKKMFTQIFGCGEYDKGIGSSFMGALSASILFSEILRAYHKGKKNSHARLWARTLEGKLTTSILIEDYENSMSYSKAGFVIIE